jgi:hypothetical protein
MTTRSNPMRVGFFSSSEIYALTVMGKIPMTSEELAARPKTGEGSSVKFKPGGFGDEAENYIREKRWERKLGRSVDTDIYARPLVWGKLCERRVNSLLGTGYHINSNETYAHPIFPKSWSGTQDGKKYTGEVATTVIEIKCPWTLPSFCKIADCMTSYEDIKGVRYSTNEDAITLLRSAYDDKTGEKWYWQIVSNADIHGLDYAELIVYMPFVDELEDIREEARNYPDDGEMPLHSLYFIGMNTNEEELPYLLRNGEYNNMNVIPFRVPEEDKLFLRSRVKEAQEKLIK